MSEENVAIRLKVFIDHLGISSSLFADKCGIPRPTLSQLLNGRNKKVNDVLVGQIHAAYPDLSIVWLLFGEGSMLVSDSSRESDDSSENAEISDSQPISGEDKGIQAIQADRLESVGNKVYAPVGGRVGNKELESMIAERDALIKELQKEIESMKKNPRKVTQITVYYDDTTFETFSPTPGFNRGRN